MKKTLQNIFIAFSFTGLFAFGVHAYSPIVSNDASCNAGLASDFYAEVTCIHYQNGLPVVTRVHSCNVGVMRQLAHNPFVPQVKVPLWIDICRRV